MKFSLTLLLISLLTFSWASPVLASPDPPKVSISPPTQEIVLNPTDHTKSFQLSITNLSDLTLSLSLSSVDLGSYGTPAGHSFLGISAQDFAKRYGLTKWLTLPADSLIFSPHQERNITFAVTNDSSLSPGGHYAAILGTFTSASQSHEVNLNLGFSSLILLKKIGGEIYDLKLTKAQPDGSWWQIPTTSTLTFQNSGNVHLVPRGTIVMTDFLGREIKRGVVNENSTFLLPQSSKSIDTKLTDVAYPILPGPYTTAISFRYVGNDSFTTYQTSAFYLGIIPSILMLLAGFAIFLASKFVFKKWKARHRAATTPQ